MHVITNGENYVIYHESDSNFSIDFTESKEEATRFPKAYPAIGVMKRFKNKLYGYYVYDECRKKPEYENRARMMLSYEQRLEIYNRANGKCVLCGKEIKINKMTIAWIPCLQLAACPADALKTRQTEIFVLRHYLRKRHCSCILQTSITKCKIQYHIVISGIFILFQNSPDFLFNGF